MSYLEDARAAAQPYFGSETILAALPVWPVGALPKQFVESPMVLRSFAALETRRSFHPQKFAAFERAKGARRTGPPHVSE